MKKWPVFLALIFFEMSSLRAFGQVWPTKPVHFLVAAPAGSSLDVIARSLSEKLKTRWATEHIYFPIIVENIAGGSGTMATNRAAKAAPDGHTLVLSFNGPLAFAPYLSQLPYDPAKDLTPVIMTTSQPNVLAVNASLPVKTTQELVKYLRANPAKLNYASVGVGSSSHLTMELFKYEAGIFATHIPFNGSPPATLSVVSGDTQMIFAVPTIIMPLVKAGKLRALAVSTKDRFGLFKDIPTIRESGIPELAQFEASAWNGVLVPSGTPAVLVQHINHVLNDIFQDDNIRRTLANSGLEVVGGSSESFASTLTAETKKWQAIVDRLGIKRDN